MIKGVMEYCEFGTNLGRRPKFEYTILYHFDRRFKIYSLIWVGWVLVELLV